MSSSELPSNVDSPTPILPGATLGVLGSGQLGRMFAIEARRLGYRVHVFSPDQDTPTGEVADVEHQAQYSDLEAVEKFARAVDVVTFEFENVPADTIEVVRRFAPVHPSGNVLHTTQNRINEKTFLTSIEIPVTNFLKMESLEDLANAGPEDFPCVLKTAAWGYDGKGQLKLDSAEQLESAWRELGEQPCVLERFVDFELELSVVACRGQDGQVVTYGPIVNSHSNHILDVSVCPYELPESVNEQARKMASTILEKLDVVGVLCVEFFLARDGRLLVNELAPRPHNSGHLTVDSHVTCQFEQQVRAICGLALGDASQRRPAAMANLLGDIWSEQEPNWAAALEIPDAHLHLYGKKEARVGRKMGHITALADTSQEAVQKATAARDVLAKAKSDET